MARSMNVKSARIWAAAKHPYNDTLFVQGFGDTMISEDGFHFSLEESAEQKAEAFLSSNPGSKIVTGAKTSEHALELAKDLLA